MVQDVTNIRELVSKKHAKIHFAYENLYRKNPEYCAFYLRSSLMIPKVRRLCWAYVTNTFMILL